MNIRLTGLSILVGALFAIPATATAVSPVTVAPIQQGEVATLVLVQAQQHQFQSKEGEEEKGQGYSNESDHGSHGHNHGDQTKQEKGMCKGKDKNKDGNKERHDHGDKGDHHHHSYTHNVAVQAEVLGLSDEQLGKIVRIHLKEDPEVHGRLKNKMKESMQAFRKAVAEPAVDEETLRKLGQKHVDSFNEMIAHHVEERKAILSILTPEQIEKLKVIKTDHNH
ncbi:hypothetical protein ABO04_01710 [Nitrosomonas sp. HPC101]|uniref:Spy/CpxP family protein refolding chaperone n=1 Tax=Nitrosomonas sp. HPC101 TaxID=1658667 RepID=UPI00136C7AFC|nr:Spy/CpxP family protein refolding chaperone [Nitrosomonas sp. HPC101]MXS84660.1 hypothetical protein [Nitrosomonas sp. HPC101]